jgi:multidrug resistance efflux pump
MIKAGKPKTWITGAVVASALAAFFFLFRDGSADAEDVPVFVVERGDLEINVLQGGEIRALKNFEVKSEIETPTKILSLIPEGYLVTEEDVKDGKVLVELDNSDLKTRIQDHEIQFQTTVASYIEADEQREIQRSENQTLFRETKQFALFALMDFEKYLGKQAAAGVLKSSGLPENADTLDGFVGALEASANMPVLKEESETKTSAKAGGAKAKGGAKGAVEDKRTNFIAHLDNNKLEDGEAQQKLRQLNDEMLLHQGEEALAKQNVEASEKLAAKSFITKTALQTDQVNLEKVTLSVKTASTQLDLFRKYEFPKQCETFLSAYREALNKLQRTVRANRSKMAQVESKFQTAKRRYEMELAKKEDLDRQLKACLIKAQVPGLVAYGDLDSSSYSRYSEPVEEGATVRIRQTILTIPDMTQMGVRLNVHESQVKKVRIGQEAIVRVDAEPGRGLEGSVAELAVLPDSASTRYTPNVKVYPCTVHIRGSHDWLKPGMNAKVEIIINHLADVTYVPVQSIEVEDDRHFCYVQSGGSLERRAISTGLFNDDFIEVRSGLNPGEMVALAPPVRLTPDAPSKDEEPADAQPKPVKEDGKKAAPAKKNIASS